MITQAYRILMIGVPPALLCLLCNRISHNPNDIENLYCDHCKRFLKDVPEDERVDIERDPA